MGVTGVTGVLVREMDRDQMAAAFVATRVEARLLRACLLRPGRAVSIIPPWSPGEEYMVFHREGGAWS